MSEWKPATLTQLGSVGRGRSRHRPRDDASLYGGEYPFIQTGDVKHSPFYITSYSQTYNEVGLAQSKLWDHGTLCITIAANIADTAILKFPACFPDSIIGFISDPEKSDVRFVKYCMDTLKVHFESISRGTTQDNLSVEKLLSIKFKVPQVAEQKKIAAILTAYDDLIENNQRRIAALEKMAEELYREWFVRLRFPGHEQVKLVKGVPQGWGLVKLGEAFEFTGGGTPSKEVGRYWTNGNVNWFTPSDITGASGMFLSDSEDQCTEEGLEQSSARLFPPYSVMMTSRATIGVVGINRTPACTNQGFITCIPNERYPLPYLYHWLKLAKPHFEMVSTGSTFAELTKGTFKRLEVLTPPEPIVKRFADLATPQFRSIDTLLLQNDSLRQTRDLLLPRLISGKLRVDALDIQFPPSMRAEG